MNKNSFISHRNVCPLNTYWNALEKWTYNLTFRGCMLFWCAVYVFHLNDAETTNFFTNLKTRVKTMYF